MEEIKITYTDSGFYIEQGDKQAEMLGWDEMLGTIAALTMPNPHPCLGWIRPKMQFKDGCFIVSESESCKWIAIIKGDDNDADYYHSYFGMYTKKQPEEIPDYWFDEPCDAQTKNRPATEEEKQILLFKLHEIGKKWNDEKKCIEDVYVPKDGDFVYGEFDDCIYTYIFKSEKNESQNNYYALCGSRTDIVLYSYWCYKGKSIRKATESEKKQLLDLLHKEGKDWDAEKREIVEYKWRPKDGEIYYFVHTSGVVGCNNWYKNSADEKLFSIGNCFKTIEEAEEKVKKFKEILSK